MRVYSVVRTVYIYTHSIINIYIYNYIYSIIYIYIYIILNNIYIYIYTQWYIYIYIVILQTPALLDVVTTDSCNIMQCCLLSEPTWHHASLRAQDHQIWGSICRLCLSVYSRCCCPISQFVGYPISPPTS